MTHRFNPCKCTALTLVFAFLAVFSCSLLGLSAHACCKDDQETASQVHCAQHPVNKKADKMSPACFCTPPDQATAINTDGLLPDLRHAATASLPAFDRLLTASDTTQTLALAHIPDESGRYLALRRLLN